MTLTYPAAFATYKDFVTALNLPFYTSSRDRRKQEQHLTEFYEFTKLGSSYTIHNQIKPYAPPLSKRNPRETHMEIKTQLLHAIAAQKAGIATRSRYGLVNEVRLTLADAFELVGLASPDWRKLKEGEALPDLTTEEQRKAYFTHHDACFQKWRNTIKSLEERKLIKRKDWFMFVERCDYLENTPTQMRLATNDEVGDCWAVGTKAMTALQTKYPHLKLNRHSDIWLKFKEIEYEHIRRKLIKEAQEKHAMLHPQYPTTWLDTFRISRFFFTDEMMEQWETYLKPVQEIENLKETLTLKMVDWYQLPSNATKYENVKLCLVSLLGAENE